MISDSHTSSVYYWKKMFQSRESHKSAAHLPHRFLTHGVFYSKVGLNTKSVLNAFKGGLKFWFSAPLPCNTQSLKYFYTTETNSDQYAIYSISGNLGIVCLLCPWIMKSMLLSKCHLLRSNNRGIFQGSCSTTIYWLIIMCFWLLQKPFSIMIP